MRNQFRAILRPVLALLCCLVCISSCKTISVEKTHEQEQVKYIYQDKVQKDNIYVLDSVFIFNKNDTIYKEKVKYIYKNIMSVDSIIKTDTLYIKDVQEKVIEKTVRNPVNIILVIYFIFTLLGVGLYIKFKK